MLYSKYFCVVVTCGRLFKLRCHHLCWHSLVCHFTCRATAMEHISPKCSAQGMCIIQVHHLALTSQSGVRMCKK